MDDFLLPDEESARLMQKEYARILSGYNNRVHIKQCERADMGIPVHFLTILTLIFISNRILSR